MVLVLLMTGAILLQAELEGMSLERVVQITAVLSGLVPYGLFFLIVLAYTGGAVTSSRRGALVQRVNAVESVSNVDVLCTDKTGTLTTGRLTVAEVAPLDPPGESAGSQGLRVGGPVAGSVEHGRPSSGVAVLPRLIVPAARSLSTTWSDQVGTVSEKAREP